MRPAHGVERATGPRGLARFRVDPEKVRVAIRRRVLPGDPPDRIWFATVEPRDVGQNAIDFPVYETGRTPRAAIARALRAARDAGIPGIDLDMQWAYPHPHAPRSSSGT